MNYPGLFTPILLALLAVLSLSLAWKQERFPEWLRVFLMLAGLILLVMATFAVIDLLADRYATYQSRMYAAQARTEAVLKLEAFARLTSEQATFFMASAANILMVMDNGLATEFVFRWMNQEIPFTFVEAFIDAGGSDYLCPVRNYPEGTNEREWARVLTGFFTQKGLAEEAKGPHPAKWLDYNGALVSLGMAEE